jgi:hypothetical protein
VVKFGDKHGAKVVHGLHQPLSDDAAAHVLSRFSFDEVPMVGDGAKSGGVGSTAGAGGGEAAGPFETMLRQSLETLREAKSRIEDAAGQHGGVTVTAALNRFRRAHFGRASAGAAVGS